MAIVLILLRELWNTSLFPIFWIRLNILLRCTGAILCSGATSQLANSIWSLSTENWSRRGYHLHRHVYTPEFFIYLKFQLNVPSAENDAPLYLASTATLEMLVLFKHSSTLKLWLSNATNVIQIEGWTARTVTNSRQCPLLNWTSSFNASRLNHVQNY